MWVLYSLGGIRFLISKEEIVKVKEQLQDQVKHERADTKDNIDYKNAEVKSRHTGTLKLNFSTKN